MKQLKLNFNKLLKETDVIFWWVCRKGKHFNGFNKDLLPGDILYGCLNGNRLIDHVEGNVYYYTL